MWPSYVSGPSLWAKAYVLPARGRAFTAGPPS